MVIDLIRELSQIEAPFGKEDRVRDFIAGFAKKLGKKHETDGEGNLFVYGGDIFLCCHMDKLDKPGKWKETPEEIQGRLDDSIGLGLMLELIRETDFSLLCTVKEEPDRSLGAKHALKKIKETNPKLIIIIDTSQYGGKGGGPILYHSSGGFRYRKKIIGKVRETAKKSKIPLQEIKKGFHNDSMVFAEANLPTVALEIHINNNHTDHEVASKTDILQLKDLLKKIAKEF